MARVVIIGASIGGLPAAYEARAMLDKKHKVAVVSNVDSFHFVPSNPWVAVGWRKRKDISFALGPVLEKNGIESIHAAADRIEPEHNRVVTAKGEVPYDYLIIAGQSPVPEHRCGRGLRGDSARGANAGTDRRAQDRIHDRIDGVGGRA